MDKITSLYVIPKMKSDFDKIIPNPSVATVLSSIIEPVEIIDMNFEGEDILVKKIKKNTYERVYMSSVVDNHGHAIKCAKLIKAIKPATRIIIGGPHVTLLGLSGSNIDKVFSDICVGESEFLLPDIYSTSVFCSEQIIKQNVWENNKHVHSSSLKKAIPKWEEVYRDEHLPIFMIEGSRGCPFHCKFCSHSDISGIKLRLRPVDDILEEMELAYEKFGISCFRFTDSELSFPKSRFRELCYKLKKYKLSIDNNMSWVGFARIKDLDSNNILEAISAGCSGLFVGVESPKENTLQLLNKNFDRKIAKEVISIANSANVIIFASYIFGLPGDTLDDIDIFIDDILDLKLNSVNVNPFFLSPFSTYHKNSVEYGIEILNKLWIEQLHDIFIHNKPYFKTSTLDQNEMALAVQKIKTNVVGQDVLWNLRDYFLLAWQSIGGSYKSLAKIWNCPEKHLSGHELNCLLEMRKRGAGVFPEQFSKHFKRHLIMANKQISSLD